jgi:hypothetical protein
VIWSAVLVSFGQAARLPGRQAIGPQQEVQTTQEMLDEMRLLIQNVDQNVERNVEQNTEWNIEQNIGQRNGRE